MVVSNKIQETEVVEKSIILNKNFANTAGAPVSAVVHSPRSAVQAGGSTFQSDMVRLRKAKNGVCGRSLYTGDEHVL